jgi:hypothetical protein
MLYALMVVAENLSELDMSLRYELSCENHVQSRVLSVDK